MQIKAFCGHTLVRGTFIIIYTGFLAIILTGCHPSRKSAGIVAAGNQATVSGKMAPEGPVSGAQVDKRPDWQAGARSDGQAGAQSDSFLVALLNNYPQYFGNMLSHPDSFRIQIIYTRIDRDAANKPLFRDYYFQVDPGQYFYPASTVKLPTALLALQRLNELRLPGLGRNSTLITGQSYSGQTAVNNDPSSVDGRPSVEQYVK